MAVSVQALIQDWYDETLTLEAILYPLAAKDWDLPTPAPGWNIRHQVAHLTWTDEALLLAASSPEEFAALRSSVLADTEGSINQAASSGAGAPADVILRRWVVGQRRAAKNLERVDSSRRLPWFGPPMGAAAAVTSRIMETFAHGQDIRDALAIQPVRSPRLRHIAHLAVAARAYSFQTNNLPVPPDEVRVELDCDGEKWVWGPEEATERINGDALDFALLATRRRHLSDLSIISTGKIATAWTKVIQAYAGPPGNGAAPLSSPLTARS